jgi:hypothetical protein
MGAVDRPVGGEHQEHRRHQHLVGDRIEHAPQGRLLGPAPGEIAVEEIGDRGPDEEGKRHPTRRVAVPVNEARHHGHPHEPAIGEQVRQAQRMALAFLLGQFGYGIAH